MRAPVLLMIACALLSSVSHANPVPDPDRCSVMPPDGMARPRIVGVPVESLPPPQCSLLDVYIADSNGVPMAGVYVEVLLNATCNDPDPLCVCNVAVLNGYTNASGNLRLAMKWGGCCLDTQAAAIRAMGIPIRTYDVVCSPDFDGLRGNCAVSLADFVYFCAGYGQSGVACRNFDGDPNEACGLPDFVEFAPAYGLWCNGQ
jgi:hypothetical protein